MKYFINCLSALLLLCLPVAGFSDPDLRIPTGTNWEQAAAKAHRNDRPIMILFSADDCSYCEQLKTELINPMLQQGELEKQALVREFNIDQGGKVTDFDGERIRSRIFVQRYQVFATPTILLVDHRGTPLVSPLVGFNDPDDYRERLEQALESAHHSLAATASPHIAGNH